MGDVVIVRCFRHKFPRKFQMGSSLLKTHPLALQVHGTGIQQYGYVIPQKSQMDLSLPKNPYQVLGYWHTVTTRILARTCNVFQMCTKYSLAMHVWQDRPCHPRADLDPAPQRVGGSITVRVYELRCFVHGWLRCVVLAEQRKQKKSRRSPNK